MAPAGGIRYPLGTCSRSNPVIASNERIIIRAVLGFEEINVFFIIIFSIRRKHNKLP